MILDAIVVGFIEYCYGVWLLKDSNAYDHWKKLVGETVDGKRDNNVFCAPEFNLNCLIYKTDGKSRGFNNKYPRTIREQQNLCDLRRLLFHCDEFRGRGCGHYIAFV
eukprot:474822_1